MLLARWDFLRRAFVVVGVRFFLEAGLFVGTLVMMRVPASHMRQRQPLNIGTQRSVLLLAPKRGERRANRGIIVPRQVENQSANRSDIVSVISLHPCARLGIIPPLPSLD